VVLTTFNVIFQLFYAIFLLFMPIKNNAHKKAAVVSGCFYLFLMEVRALSHHALQTAFLKGLIFSFFKYTAKYTATSSTLPHQ